MGIVTGHAGQAGIAFAPTPAVFKTVWREADVVHADSSETNGHHILPSAVAGAAKIHRINRIQAAGIHDQLLALLLQPRSHCGCMTRSWAVARLASNSKNGAVWIKLIFGHRRCCMTAKTSAGFAGRHPPSRSLFQAAGCGRRLSGSDIQILQRDIKTEMAFVKGLVFLVDIRLPYMADAECPKQVDGEGLRLIAAGNRQNAFPALGHDLLAVWAEAVVETVMLVKYLRVRRTSGGVGHGIGLLSLNLGGVAFRALTIAHVTVSRGVPFCGPPAGGLDPHCGGQGDATRGRSLSQGLTGHCKDHDRQEADAGSPGLRQQTDGRK